MTIPSSDPLVSVILPAFNRGAYIAGALESVMAQTWTRWELIVVDDGSTDETAAVARQYADAHRGVIVLTQDNRGVAAARNTGIRRARGSYIAFIDSDDLWRADKL